MLFGIQLMVWSSNFQAAGSLPPPVALTKVAKEWESVAFGGSLCAPKMSR